MAHADSHERGYFVNAEKRDLPIPLMFCCPRGLFLEAILDFLNGDLHRCKSRPRALQTFANHIPYGIGDRRARAVTPFPAGRPVLFSSRPARDNRITRSHGFLCACYTVRCTIHANVALCKGSLCGTIKAAQELAGNGREWQDTPQMAFYAAPTWHHFDIERGIFLGETPHKALHFYAVAESTVLQQIRHIHAQQCTRYKPCREWGSGGRRFKSSRPDQ